MQLSRTKFRKSFILRLEHHKMNSVLPREKSGQFEGNIWRYHGSGVRQSRSTVWPLTTTRVWAWASPGPRLGLCPWLLHCRIRHSPGHCPGSWALGCRPGWGAPRPPASSGALARPVQLQTRGLSARGRTVAADRLPGCWAQSAGPVWALFTRSV